ncbi:uncharacterized protein OCT59_018120 [Rhizophagus irregularis]|uniref:Uncharacterized protein n=3 Tax=Rhizophagus irregularis TaxID=588596 RepID=A0A2N1NFD3_9GLOM|nr:hypothetical protein GLOIN_2v1618214 [Rhizophagus irregularis DAOM 181602=DAOM 197198]EXX75624.1 hypothetical protein RirG_040330 [Rhizophagus irregularis DAOM 197198w]PKK72579.1 hypothetical protein RhiirC2_742390 [Rhizophagus irregularis]POG70291.1 hypothetical protein GLOIN_2v1618214 [Rhizophagus irregularis DAOM 181602=DAOM 197198]UZO25863.1 hypothetical protein OCT59_018120 [Rhizophagus irregularis]CAB4394101.1 unnamed protein product [Rhizophagus irregularis]|eukprot:XP_025177157.1 hypothetical protein GLOIN_2v1618214 [Rhizophagus irregularis DAOM 181602=DAOM 197198]
MENNNKGRNYRRSNNWSSQDGIDQNYSGRIRSRARSNHSKRIFTSPKIFKPTQYPSPPLSNIVASNAPNDKSINNVSSGFIITGITIGSLIFLTIIVYLLIRFIRKRRESSKSREVQEDEELPHPRLTLNFVKHNHAIPELCTTPDTQPILDYYSSKAGLTDNSSPPIINSNKVNKLSHFIKEDNNDHKSTPVELTENIRKSSEENVNTDYVPQYYNGMEIPPLGARIIPLERQVQIAKELTSVNNNNNNKRKSNRSISSLLSINSRRKSSTSNYHYNYNNSSTPNSLSQISETPQNEGAAKIVS